MHPFPEYSCPIKTSIKIDVYEDGFWDLLINDKPVAPIEFTLCAKQFSFNENPLQCNPLQRNPLVTYTVTLDPSAPE